MDNLALYVSVRGQYSAVPLLSSEEFSFGGNVSGRGYDPSEISGDQGVAATIELRYSGLPELWKMSPELFHLLRSGQSMERRPRHRCKDESAASAGAGCVLPENHFPAILPSPRRSPGRSARHIWA